MDSVATLSLALQSQLGSGPDLTARGAWAIGTAYVANDVVTRSGLTYVNILANTGSDPATDAGVHWVVAGTVGTPAFVGALLALASGLVSSARAVAVSRLSRRVGLLTAQINPLLLPSGTNVGEVSEAFTEVLEANVFLGRAQALNNQVAQLRSNIAPLIANIPVATLSSWANDLTAAASDFETLELETLPS
jgi:hypothetical protein